MKRELPDDLARLGLYLEVAAGETLRRRQRRQTMANFVGAVTLAVPFASPSPPPTSPRPTGSSRRGPSRSRSTSSRPNKFMVRPIPDEPPPPTLKESCLNAQDCRAPVTPSLTPAPAGKH